MLQETWRETRRSYLICSRCGMTADSYAEDAQEVLPALLALIPPEIDLGLPGWQPPGRTLP